MELGRYGVWILKDQISPELARQIEKLGYGAIWVGASPMGDLSPVGDLLAATHRIVIATGVVNIWATPAEEAAKAYHRFANAYPDRFMLGVGTGHREQAENYHSPFASMVDYLDRLDAAKVPASGRVLAALGPRMLQLASERASGAHPYFVPHDYTNYARHQLGPKPLLAPEQKIVLESDSGRARAIARPTMDFYLARTSYVSNLRRLGWTEQDLTGGSDDLLDVLIVHGDAAAIAAGLAAHLDEGADHVCAQVLAEPKANPLSTLRAVAVELGLARRG